MYITIVAAILFPVVLSQNQSENLATPRNNNEEEKNKQSQVTQLSIPEVSNARPSGKKSKAKSSRARSSKISSKGPKIGILGPLRRFLLESSIIIGKPQPTAYNLLDKQGPSDSSEGERSNAEKMSPSSLEYTGEASRDGFLHSKEATRKLRKDRELENRKREYQHMTKAAIKYAPIEKLIQDIEKDQSYSKSSQSWDSNLFDANKIKHIDLPMTHSNRLSSLAFRDKGIEGMKKEHQQIQKKRVTFATKDKLVQTFEIASENDQEEEHMIERSNTATLGEMPQYVVILTFLLASPI